MHRRTERFLSINKNLIFAKGSNSSARRINGIKRSSWNCMIETSNEPCNYQSIQSPYCKPQFPHMRMCSGNIRKAYSFFTRKNLRVNLASLALTIKRIGASEDKAVTNDYTLKNKEAYNFVGRIKKQTVNIGTETTWPIKENTEPKINRSIAREVRKIVIFQKLKSDITSSIY